MERATRQNILEEAIGVVKDRQGEYGKPSEHWARTVKLVNAHFGTTFRPQDWGTIMILDKLARQVNAPKRDNMVDVAGYANGVQMVQDDLVGSKVDSL